MHFGCERTDEAASRCRGAGRWLILWYSVRYVRPSGWTAARCAWRLRLLLCATRLTSLRASTSPLWRSMGWVRLPVSFLNNMIIQFGSVHLSGFAVLHVACMHFRSGCISVGSAQMHHITWIWYLYSFASVTYDLILFSLSSLSQVVNYLFLSLITAVIFAAIFR